MRLNFDVPSGWAFPSVNELASSEKGAIRIGPFGSSLKKAEYSESGIRVLGIDQVHPNKLVWEKPKYIPLAKYKELTQYTVQAGDVLVTNMGTVGRTCFVPNGFPTAIISSHLIKISPDFNKVEPSYLCWVLNFCPIVVAQIRAKCQGAIMAGFNTSLLKSIQIPLPPLEEQRRIAAILDKADAVRRKRQQAIALTEELLRSAFLEMFGDPVTNPKGWNVRKFSEVGVLDRGISKHRPRNASELLGGVYPLIQTGDVANCDRYIRSYTSTYSEIGLRQSRMWKTGTLCITIAANIAKTGILTFDACFPDSIVGFQPNNLSATEYVQYWLSFLQTTLEATAPQSAQKNINLAILRNLDIPVPPINLQKEFACRIEANEQLKTMHRESLTQLNALFNSLLQRAFSGELLT